MKHLEKHNVLRTEKPSGRYSRVVHWRMATDSVLEGGAEDQYFAHRKRKKFFIMSEQWLLVSLTAKRWCTVVQGSYQKGF
jgi:hypothetical protein